MNHENESAPGPEIHENALENRARASLRSVAGLLRRTPWLAASVLFHFALLLAATVIGFRLEKPGEGPGVEIHCDLSGAKAPVFPTGEARSRVERNGLPAIPSERRGLRAHRELRE